MGKSFVLILLSLASVLPGSGKAEPSTTTAPITNAPPVRAEEAGGEAFVPKTPGRVRFALCQTPCGFFRPETRTDEILKWVRRRLRGDEDVVVLPELAFSSFAELPGAWRNATEVWEKSASFARERRVFLFVNHPSREDGTGEGPFGETRVFSPAGNVVAVYRKRVLARMDLEAMFSPGPASAMVGLPFARIGCLVCKDAFSPAEGGDLYAGADILLAQFAHSGVDDVHAPEAQWFPDSGMARSGLRASRFAWLGLGKPYLAVNKAGPDGSYRLCGGSFASDGAGETVVSADALPDVLFVDFLLGPDGRIASGPVLPDQPSAAREEGK